MGLFGDKLLLKINASSLASGLLKIQLERVDHKVKHLLPFSCVSLIASQLTVLSSRHPRLLSQRVLEFIENPERDFEAISYLSGFNLQIFEGSGQVLYNQFEPLYARSLSALDDNPLQTDIERMLMNYVTLVFNESKNIDRENLRVFLLITIVFYQEQIIPIMKQINMHDLVQRNKLAKTYIDFTSMLYQTWHKPKSVSPGNQLFSNQLNSAKTFEAYLL